MGINPGYLVVYSIFFGINILILQKMGASRVEALVTINLVISLLMLSKGKKKTTHNK